MASWFQLAHSHCRHEKSSFVELEETRSSDVLPAVWRFFILCPPRDQEADHDDEVWNNSNYPKRIARNMLCDIVISFPGRTVLLSVKMQQVSLDNGDNKEGILHPDGSFMKTWHEILLVSCVLAVFVDPFFFYLPRINDDNKCIVLDKRLEVAAICFRSITDMIYVVNIVLQFLCPYKIKDPHDIGRTRIHTKPQEIRKKYLSTYFVVDILAILPIPQVVIPITFTERRGLNSLNQRKFLKALALLQYVPRIVRIYLTWKKLNETSNRIQKSIHARAALNLFLYILASHMYMQLKTSKQLKILKNKKERARINDKKKSIESWISRNGLRYGANISKRKSKPLKAFGCDYLKHVYYYEGSYIVRAGEPLDRMLLITEGVIWKFASSSEETVSSSWVCLEKGQFCGEELLDWGFKSTSPSPCLSNLPISPMTLKTHTKVEAFVLTADDLMGLLRRHYITPSPSHAASTNHNGIGEK
ncbi:Cyclic nucleotide-gated ion channel 1 [Morella rubra]|uniref:Cyclic nucleotide-gated ion channel 1 n=1 Tax=Morella rubra TaxID=262757 RepID=A0A6A1UXF1_9ROSI|nr:Cyclic nucleotide-gated ion channel 1 [Morella rubra]